MLFKIARSYLFKTNDEEIFDIIKSDEFYDTELFKKCKSINSIP